MVVASRELYGWGNNQANQMATSGQNFIEFTAIEEINELLSIHPQQTSNSDSSSSASSGSDSDTSSSSSESSSSDDSEQPETLGEYDALMFEE
jgi:hypothetical protein